MKNSKKFIPIASPVFNGNEKKYLNKALESTWISSKGEFISSFETEFAKYAGSKYAVSTSSGTAALHIALKALNIGKNDEVLVSNLTFIASVNSISYTGAKPVLVDIDKKNWNMDIKEMEKKLTKKTRAIMVVHLYGVPTDMEEIMKIADRRKIFVIEDNAEAIGAEVFVESQRWEKTGSVGNIGCFSFFGNKIITTGEGGMAVTDDEILAKRMRMLRDHGQDPQKRYFHPVIGFNYRMTNLQAAIGLAQLEKIDHLLKFKKKLAVFYNRHLKGIPGIIFPVESKNTRSVCWLFSIIVDKPYSLSRDRLIAKLIKNGIETRPFFYPINSLPSYFSKKSYPISEYISGHGLNLPSGYNLKEEDIKFICQNIRNQ